MARYYLVAADRDDGLAAFVEPQVFADRDSAVAQASHKIGLAGAGIRPHLIAGLEYRFLLDVGSVDIRDTDELLRLILTDPLLNAVYEVGKATERMARNRD